MSRIPCTVGETELENDEGHLVDSVSACCTKCLHETESFGTSEASVLRCLALMREECPNGEHNFYYNEDDGPP